MAMAKTVVRIGEKGVIKENAVTDVTERARAKVSMGVVTPMNA